MQTCRTETSNKIAGFSALAFIAAITILPFIALSLYAAKDFAIGAVISDPYVQSITRFTLWQAFLSTVLSVGLAIPVALAFSRQQHFPGRNSLLKLFALPLALPALVGVMAVLGLWGKSGWLNQINSEMVQFSIFGLPGILIAHIFFNLPLATRLLLTGLDRIPAQNWRLAAQLSMPATSIFKHIEWPALRSGLAPVLALVFMLCLTSFTIVLILGGGPAATTLEVAIYQALRFDFNPANAVTLALIQLVITGLVLAISFKLTKTLTHMPAITSNQQRPHAKNISLRTFDFTAIILAAAFVTLPLTALIIDGLGADLARLLTTPALWKAIATSLTLAFFAGLLSLGLGWMMLNAITDQNGLFAQAVRFSSSAILVMPAIVIGSGWFIILLKFGKVFSFTPVLVITINALMALPFVHRILEPAIIKAHAQHGRLVTALAITGWTKWRLIDLPVLKQPLALAFAFAAALSLGDLGVIALFDSQNITTLPLLLFKSLGSYRTDDAQGLALILAVLCLAILWSADKYASRSTANA